jgi:hypothetical protein
MRSPWFAAKSRDAVGGECLGQDLDRVDDLFALPDRPHRFAR